MARIVAFTTDDIDMTPEQFGFLVQGAAGFPLVKTNGRAVMSALVSLTPKYTIYAPDGFGRAILTVFDVDASNFPTSRILIKEKRIKALVGSAVTDQLEYFICGAGIIPTAIEGEL